MTRPIESASRVAARSEDGLASLNEAQRQAVEYGIAPGTRAPPLLILAGAGSGKTNTLAYRVAQLIIEGADPRRVLLMTFSRRAAIELERRCARVVERVLKLPARGAGIGLPWSGTFHSVAARLLREYAASVGLDPGFTILDRGDSVDLMGLVRHELGYSRQRQRFPEKATCLAIYSRVVNAHEELRTVLDAAFPWCSPWHDELVALFSAYVAQKQEQHLLDYDDLLLYWEQMAISPGLGASIAARFDHVLVDEYQDTNRLQANILHALWPDGAGVTVVGDDAQAIYSFRAATVENILEFSGRFEPAARCITLEQNYRSTTAILAACNAVIGEATQGFRKALWSERDAQGLPRIVTVRDEVDEANYVADGVLARREMGLRLKDQAVLFRTASHSAVLELELTRRNIPFVKFGGLKFLEAAHVKDVLAVLRWADNPQNRLAAARVVQILPQVGPATTARLVAALPGAESALTALTLVKPQAGARDDWDALSECLSAQNDAAAWPLDLARALDWYKPHLLRRFEDGELRWRDLAQLLQIAPVYGTRQRFLTELTLDPPEASSDEAGTPHLDEDYLILSTIHSAKGQEWRAVSVLRVVDGCIPSDMATGSVAEIEEERRLLYVAMTRARDELELIVPQRFYVHHQAGLGDKHVYALPSRFISNATRRFFEQRVWPEVVFEERPAALPTPATLDLAALVRSRWNAK
jgi:DNA helicase-2/ATP-dependent DNA helicase PcrA